MRTFRVITSGPCFTTRQASIDDAATWAEQYLPLKRGWVVERSSSTPERAVTIRVRNSRGRVVNAVRVFEASAR